MNSIIYKITNNLNNEVYFGSTIQTLKARIYDHKKHYNQFLKNKKKRGWCQSYQIIMDDNYKAEEIEDYPFASLKELRQREDHYILNYDNINDKRAHNTPEEKKTKKAIADKRRYLQNKLNN